MILCFNVRDVNTGVVLVCSLNVYYTTPNNTSLTKEFTCNIYVIILSNSGGPIVIAVNFSPRVH
jgi:hypothetical protein